MTAKPAGEDEPTRRDFTMLWRVSVLVLSGASTLIGTIGIFAAKSYIREVSTEIISQRMALLEKVPGRLDRVEEIVKERGVLHSEYARQDMLINGAIIRLTANAEETTRVLVRQQTILDNQQVQIGLLQRAPRP